MSVNIHFYADDDDDVETFKTWLVEYCDYTIQSMDSGASDNGTWHLWNIIHEDPDALTQGGIIETIETCADAADEQDAEMDPNAIPNANRLQRIQDTIEIVPANN